MRHVVSHIVFFFIPYIIFALLVSRPPINSGNSDLGSLRGLLTPLPTKVRALVYYREKNAALSSLVVSRLIPCQYDYALAWVTHETATWCSTTLVQQQKENQQGQV